MPERWLGDLIAIPSPSGQESAVAAHLAAWGRERDLEVHDVGGNVSIRLPGRDPTRALILHAHMDVVSPGDPGRWSADPYFADLRDNCIYGSGASDDKAGIAVALAVADGLRDMSPPIDLWLAFVVQEETDGAGSIAFADWFEKGWKPRYHAVGALVFEATDCAWLEYEAKGSLFLDLQFEGAVGHAAQKDMLGPTAISRMAEGVRRVAALEAEWRQQGHAGASAVVTAVRAGDPAAPNRLSGQCEMVVDIRTTRAMHAGALSDAARHLDGLVLRMAVRSASPPAYTDPGSGFIQAFEAAVPGIGKRRSIASNDLFAFSAIGVPAFVYGPGTKSAIHRPDEYVPVANLATARSVVRDFLAILGSRDGW